MGVCGEGACAWPATARVAEAGGNGEVRRGGVKLLARGGVWRLAQTRSHAAASKLRGARAGRRPGACLEVRQALMGGRTRGGHCHTVLAMAMIAPQCLGQARGGRSAASQAKPTRAAGRGKGCQHACTVRYNVQQTRPGGAETLRCGGVQRLPRALEGSWALRVWLRMHSTTIGAVGPAVAASENSRLSSEHPSAPLAPGRPSAPASVESHTERRHTGGSTRSNGHTSLPPTPPPLRRQPARALLPAALRPGLVTSGRHHQGAHI